VEGIKNTFSSAAHHCLVLYDAVARKINYLDKKVEKWAYDRFSPQTAYVSLRILRALPFTPIWAATYFAPLPALAIALGSFVTLSIVKPDLFTGKKTIAFLTGSAMVDAGFAAYYFTNVFLSPVPVPYLILTAMSCATVVIGLFTAKSLERQINANKSST